MLATLLLMLVGKCWGRGKGGGGTGGGNGWRGAAVFVSEDLTEEGWGDTAGLAAWTWAAIALSACLALIGLVCLLHRTLRSCRQDSQETQVITRPALC